MSYLLIVESPGKISKISEYLGHEYIVMASIGHIIDLDGGAMNINLETFEPIYQISKDKFRVVADLTRAAKKVGLDNVMLAADEDREGEMIAWSLARELNLHNPKRIVFNSITAKELNNAVANPKIIDQNMVKAQQARRILDRLAGYLISPLLKRVGLKIPNEEKILSAGRVQSVVVKIIVDKEKEIINFFSKKKDTYFYITSNVTIGKYELLTKLANINTKIEHSDNSDNLDNEDSDNENTSKKKSKSKPKIVSTSNTISSRSYTIFEKNQEELVVKIIKAMIKSQYIILNTINKIKKSYPSPPFTTSTLQQWASQRLGMDAKRTMSVAQKLYEAGHITYMRTDSTSISVEAAEVLKKTITDKYGIIHHQAHDYTNKKANTQEAHECVRPTKPTVIEIDGSSDEKRLYSTILKRTIQSQMKAAEYQNIIIEIGFKGKDILIEYKLVGTLENLTYAGYLIVDGKEGSESLPLNELNNVTWISINGIEDTSKPPVRYNDASLIRQMDPKNLNIGRPSTYASFIDKILNRKYVEIKNIEGNKVKVAKYTAKATNPKIIDCEIKEIIIGKDKNKLVPTELGTIITNFLEENFPILMDYKFTANMEKELDDVADGTLNKLKVIKSFYDYVQTCIETINNKNIIGTHNNLPIKLNDGQYGKYITYNNNKYNLSQIAKEFLLTVDTLLSDDKILLDIIIKKIDNPLALDTPNIISVYKNLPIKINDGTHGKYITYNDNKYNLLRIAKELLITEDELISNKKLLSEKIIQLIDNPQPQIQPNQTILKEWKINKFKYLLKNGQWGHFIEEWSTITNIKKQNYSMKFAISKIIDESKMKIDENSINNAIELITITDIKQTIEYFNTNNKKIIQDVKDLTNSKPNAKSNTKTKTKI